MGANSTANSTSTRPRVRFAQLPNGRSLAYATHGSGPLLLLPAWWVSHLEKDWEHALYRHFFTRLGERFTVVRYDRLGSGLSDRARTVCSLDDELELFEGLIDQLGYERFSLLGISCGGPVAVAYAAEHPDRVEQLLLVGSFLNGATVGAPKIRDAVIGLVRANWGLGSRALADLFVPNLERAEFEALVERQRSYTDAETAAVLLRLTYTADVTDHAPHVRAATLVVHRRNDRAIRFEAGRELAAAIPGADLVILPGQAHPPWFDGDDILDAIEGFMDRVADAPAERGWAFDRDQRQLIVDGRAIGLTPLEYATLTYLSEHADRVITRTEFLREVWDQSYGGSNVVDACIRSLRRKLGDRADVIETVVGHGYRLRG